MPIGPITLANTLPTSLLNIRPDSGDEHEDDDSDDRDRRRVTRRGKMGIRNGFALDDED